MGLVWARKDGADAGTTFYVCGATGVGTYGWELRGGAPGGASTLTTVGSIPFVTAAGVLGQSGNLFWDNANARLNLGSTVRANGQVLNMYESGNIRYGIGVATSALRFYNPGTGNNTVFGTVSTADGSTFAEQMRLVGATGNLLLGTTTDGNFRLDVAASGSSGTARVYDQTPTTGSTSLIVRAGAGQSSNNLQTWQNAAGTAIAATGPTGRMFSPRFTTLIDSGWALQDDFNANVPLLLASGRGIGFSSTTSSAGALDLSLSRASANVLQVGDGSANSNGTILARIHTWANGTEGTCDATLRGQVVMVQGGAGVADRLRLCRKDATDTYLWAPVDNNVALQVVSAGPTATVTNQVRRVYVDPASVIASLTLTLPATPLDADQVQVYFGGTVANRAAVVTTLSIAPNTGHAISQFNAPAHAFGGDMVTYEFRAAAARWFRIQ